MKKLRKSNKYPNKQTALDLQETYKKWLPEQKTGNPLLYYPEILEIGLDEFEFIEETKQEEKIRIKKEEFETKLKTDHDFFLNTKVRPLRDQKINSLRWLKERHLEEKEREQETTLTDEQYVNLLEYTQDLRDFPAAITAFLTDEELQLEFNKIIPDFIPDFIPD